MRLVLPTMQLGAPWPFAGGDGAEPPGPLCRRCGHVPAPVRDEGEPPRCNEGPECECQRLFAVPPNWRDFPPQVLSLCGCDVDRNVYVIWDRIRRIARARYDELMRSRSDDDWAVDHVLEEIEYFREKRRDGQLDSGLPRWVWTGPVYLLKETGAQVLRGFFPASDWQARLDEVEVRRGLADSFGDRRQPFVSDLIDAKAFRRAAIACGFKDFAPQPGFVEDSENWWGYGVDFNVVRDWE